MNTKLTIIIPAAFILGYFVSLQIHKPNGQYMNDKIKEFYTEISLSQDIDSSYYIVKNLNEMHTKKLQLENASYLEFILWGNLEVIDSAIKNNNDFLNKKQRKKYNYILDYKNTYMKNNPNKKIKHIRYRSFGRAKSRAPLI